MGYSCPVNKSVLIYQSASKTKNIQNDTNIFIYDFLNAVIMKFVTFLPSDNNRFIKTISSPLLVSMDFLRVERDIFHWFSNHGANLNIWKLKKIYGYFIVTKYILKVKNSCGYGLSSRKKN